MTSALTSAEQQALTQFHQLAKAHLGSRLLECRLFGSKARGDDHPESDLDVLVVIAALQYADKYWTITCGADISLEYLVELSPLVLSPQQFQQLVQRERRLALDIEREGIPL